MKHLIEIARHQAPHFSLASGAHIHLALRVASWRRRRQQLALANDG
jgi:hypothetical protein